MRWSARAQTWIIGAIVAASGERLAILKHLASGTFDAGRIELLADESSSLESGGARRYWAHGPKASSDGESKS